MPPKRLSEAQAERLIKLYDAAEKKILAEYNRALLKGNDLKNLTALKNNVAAIRKDLLAGGRTWCEDAIPALYQAAMADVDSAMAAQVVFGAVHQQAMQVLAENTFSR